MQLGCRAMENREAIENKGQVDELRQVEPMENCAIRDAVAQQMCRMAQMELNRYFVIVASSGKVRL
jgi:hypothetical protein